MKCLLKRIAVVFVCMGLFRVTVQAQDYWTAGVTELRAFGTNLNGSGTRVAQPEGPYGEIDDWEVDPNFVSQPEALFTYYSNGLSTNVFPNSLGDASDHANYVAWNFYGLTTGVAPNIAHVDSYNATYFPVERENILGNMTNYFFSLPSSNIDDPVVNQSFIFEDVVSNQPVQAATNEQEAADTNYDTYAAKYNTLFVSGAGDGTTPYVSPPATCYNGIGVGVYEGGASSPGPTIDNGRCKPDMTAIAPGGATSYSAPLVAGSAAILIQAGLRGDGGSDTNSAANIMTVKALLLDGTVKPGDWHNIPPEPLDTNYGTGVLNV